MSAWCPHLVHLSNAPACNAILPQTVQSNHFNSGPLRDRTICFFPMLWLPFSSSVSFLWPWLRSLLIVQLLSNGLKTALSIWFNHDEWLRSLGLVQSSPLTFFGFGSRFLGSNSS